MSTATVVPTRRVFTIGTELRRQASRPRTRIALAFMVVLPLIVLGAFEFGRTSGGDNGNPGGAFANLVDVATAGGPNFALFTLLVSSNFLLVVDIEGTPRTDVVAALVRAGVGVDRVVPRRRLEDAFLTLVGGDSKASGER